MKRAIRVIVGADKARRQADFLALFSDVSRPCPVCHAPVRAPCVSATGRPIEVVGDIHAERAP